MRSGEEEIFLKSKRKTPEGSTNPSGIMIPKTLAKGSLSRNLLLI
jgi:hypothetical protein